jgi:transglutaminase-like putative cysteine protease
MVDGPDHRGARALALLLACALTGCPEQRPESLKQPPRPPQGALAAGAGSLPDVLTLRRPEGAEWFGLYIAGKKAGWQSYELVRELRDGKDVLVQKGGALIRVILDGKQVERRMEEERVYEARPGGRLLSLAARFSGDGGDRVVKGSCLRDRCTLRIESPGAEPEERVLEGITENADFADGERLVAQRHGALRGHLIETLKVRPRETEIAFVRRERLVAPGVEEEVSVVTEQEVGDKLPTEWRIADDGRVVDMRQGEGVLVRAEPEVRAKALENVELFALGRVPVPRPLPRDVPATIVYQLAGLPRGFWTDDARQRFTPGSDGTVSLAVTARTPLAADPARDTPLAQAAKGADPEDVSANGSADSDHPAIVALARQVAGDARGAYAAALRLSTTVHERLRTAYGASHDRASDVLAAGRGDCSEHAVLTVALARALGIPSREVYGLVYASMDGKDALYWHAWVEVRSAGEWIAIDPTFGQPVADATHVALSGRDRSDAGGLIAALQVKGVEVRPAESPRQAGKTAAAQQEPRNK